MIIDADGKISYVSIGKEAEVKQLQNLLEDLKDKWLLGDRGNRNAKVWQQFWEDKQIKVKITGGKERQWIENVFGFLKTKLGLDKIRVRKMPSFLARLTVVPSAISPKLFKLASFCIITIKYSLLLLNNLVILEYSGMFGKRCLKLCKSQK
ncbi:MAG: hypothetical protein WCG23_08605 [bacterium]